LAWVGLVALFVFPVVKARRALLAPTAVSSQPFPRLTAQGRQFLSSRIPYFCAYFGKGGSIVASVVLVIFSTSC